MEIKRRARFSLEQGRGYAKNYIEMGKQIRDEGIDIQGKRNCLYKRKVVRESIVF